MTRAQFIEELIIRLNGLSDEDINKSIAYYEEIINDRIEDGMTEKQAVAAVGNLDVIVREVKAAKAEESGRIEYKNKQSTYGFSHFSDRTADGISAGFTQKTTKPSGTTFASRGQERAQSMKKKQNKWLWIALIIVCVPLWVTIVSMIFGIAVAVCAIGFSLYIVVGALVIAGIACVVCGIAMLFAAAVPSGLVSIGIGFICTAAGLLLIYPASLLGKSFVKSLKAVTKKVKKLFAQHKEKYNEVK